MLPALHADLGLALQSGRGSPGTSATFRTPLAGGSLLPIATPVDDPTTTISRAGFGSYIERVAAEGDLVFHARPSMLGLLLHGALGAKAVAGAGPYVHTFTLASAQPWLTAWTMVGDGLLARIADVKVRALTIDAHAGGPLRVTASLAGLTPTARTAAQTATLERTDAFLHADGAGGLLVEGEAVATIEDISVSLVTGAQLVDGLNGPDLRDGRAIIRIRTVQALSDLALWNRLHFGNATPAPGDPAVEAPLELGGSPAGIDFKWTRRTGRSLEVLAPRIVVVAPIEGLEGDPDGGPLKATVTYAAYLPASGAPFSAVLTNGVASY